MHIEETREISELSHGCSPKDDRNAKTSSSLPAPSPTDPAFYNYLNNLPPLGLKKSASNGASLFDTSLSHPPPVFGSAHVHGERGTSSLKGSQTEEVFKVERDYRTGNNFLKEVHPVAFKDIKFANLNSQPASNSYPQNNYSSFHKEMAIRDHIAELSTRSHEKIVAEDNTANLSTEADGILQLASLGQDGNAAIDDIFGLTFEEVSPCLTNLDGLFPLEINNIARPASFQVECQAVKPSFSGHGQAHITSFYMNTKPHEYLSKWRVNSDTSGKDFGASNVNTNKRRKKSVSTRDSQGGRGCNCKMSKCLKLYCECFKAGRYCHGPCTCESCYNRHDYDDIVEDKREEIETRNPLAFAPKVVNNCASTKEEENNVTISTAKHRRGCNCKKSKCLKKYCECFQAKVGCSFACRCEDCQNSYGIKTENARSERMNTGSTNQLFAHSNKFSSFALPPLPWNPVTHRSNLMRLSQTCHDATGFSSLRNWRGFTGDQIQESTVSPTIDNSFQWKGYANFSQYCATKTLDDNFPNNLPSNTMEDKHVANITRDSGVPTNILRADIKNKFSPSLHNRSDLPMSTSSFDLTLARN